jgi:hypothetical protein
MALPLLLLRDRSRHEGNGVIAKPSRSPRWAMSMMVDL